MALAACHSECSLPPVGSRVAVVGGGVSGLVAARLLCADYDVHLFESGDYLGGHANTVDATLAGQTYPVDTGFMVYNDRNYPNFSRLLKMLGVESRASDMSFSVRCDQTGWEYEGSSLNGLFAQRSNLWNPAFYRMLWDVLRFNREARGLAQSLGEQATLGELLARGDFGPQFVNTYLVPMGAAIWSCRAGRFLDFPARFVVGFFENHGLLQVTGHPQWRTIVGGSREYVEALAAPYRHRVRLAAPVARVERHDDHVRLTPRQGRPERFAAVVLATHADVTLRMLADPSPAEREILGAFAYEENHCTLHSDSALLPVQLRAWASWNYHVPRAPDRPVNVTYNLSKLQGHRSRDPLCVTLNGGERVEPGRVLRRLRYEHPQFGGGALSAQRRHEEINGRRLTYYCGAYWGNGFHEDGVNSALAVGRHFGKRLESCIAPSTKASFVTAGSSPWSIALSSGCS